MTEQKRQQIAAMMDEDLSSAAAIDQLVSDPEMRSLWSRFHLVRDIMQGEVPEVIDPQLDVRIHAAIMLEPTLLVPSARQTLQQTKEEQTENSQQAIKGSTFVLGNIRSWATQATGFAIAASVTAMMVYGVQLLNTPATISPTAIMAGRSAITSLELLEVGELKIADEMEYSRLQQDLIDYTRVSSRYGIQYMTPNVSVVSHSITGPLPLLKSTFDSIFIETDVATRSFKENEHKAEDTNN